MSEKNPLPNANSRLWPGPVPVIHSGQPPPPSSPPGKNPGKISFFSESCAPSYSFSSAVTCGFVRQVFESDVLQSKIAGSKWHCRGSFKMPSVTPSFASHAALTAVAIIGILLCFHQRLAPAIRAVCKIRMLRRVAVKCLDRRFAYHRHLVDGAVREVDNLLGMPKRPSRVGAFCCVAGVRGGR